MFLFVILVEFHIMKILKLSGIYKTGMPHNNELTGSILICSASALYYLDFADKLKLRLILTKSTFKCLLFKYF